MTQNKDKKEREETAAFAAHSPASFVASPKPPQFSCQTLDEVVYTRPARADADAVGRSLHYKASAHLCRRHNLRSKSVASERERERERFFAPGAQPCQMQETQALPGRLFQLCVVTMVQVCQCGIARTCLITALGEYNPIKNVHIWKTPRSALF